jgi:predicted metal-dependent phosphoesterase TrpH
VAAIRQAGGIAALAHPGILRRDDLIPELVGAGLAALEAFHSDHDREVTAHYRNLARTHDLAVSGGSDFHGDGTRRAAFFGSVGLPADDFERLCARRERRSSSP